ncbi:hypothetical protein FXN63_18815 [Pigmentiphaga aceris]|uniref:Uncharacterized protein n=1 Tax=Pigmentiphaga aceris TaxID=1940612 RepID=A0A5C0AYX3_9BURK|nr:hypothetical protein [Pigmentiphaga aceris]QEI07662.1 hypothetical protein FXN63_18815 [Pigmentiphaga aceris]
MKKLLFLIALAVCVLIGAYLIFKRHDPAQDAPRKIEVGMRMTVNDLIERNRLDMGPRVPQGYVIDVDKLGDVMPMYFDDNWITLHLLDGDQIFDLPPGRTLQISQNAGRVIGLSFRPFAQPRPLSDMQAYVTDLIASLERKGWQRTSSSKIPAGPEDFDVGAKSVFGAMRSPSGSELTMTLRDYGLAPKHESFIIVPDPTHKPAQRSQTYLLEIDVGDGRTEGYAELVYPRRIFETGDKNHALPLRRWIEAPDWTPEKAGMVPTTAEERAKPDASDWKMPPISQR